MADPLSPEWWLHRLTGKLASQRQGLDSLFAYYDGKHPLPHIPRELDRKYLLQFHELLRQCRSNFMELVVDATAERLIVQGFRLSAEADAQADKESWRIWQANALDKEIPTAFTWALCMGRAYLSVWSGDEFPTIAVEDPREVYVEAEPGNRRRRAAAIKCWADDWGGIERANVYLPGGIYKWGRKPDAARQAGEGWSPLDEGAFVANPVGVVPIVPLVNRPHTGVDGRSEIAGVTPIQDRINATIFNRMLAGWFAAFRQKWGTGIEIPEDPETGKPIEPFKAAIDRVWLTENPEAKFGTFDATDPEPYLKGHERDIQDIAVITRTPRHYLFQTGQSPSGDAIKSAETGLVAKVGRVHGYFADPLEETLILARRFAGETTVPVDSEVLWADPEYRSEGMITDAIVKQYAEGLVSLPVAQAKLGYTPQEIERMAADRMAEAFTRELGGLLRGEGEETEPVAGE